MTISQTVSNFTNITLDNLDELKIKAIGFVKTHGVKISAISMASKLFVMATFMLIIPIGIVPTKAQVYDTKISLDKNSPLAVKPVTNVTTVELGESNFAKTQREQNEAQNAVVAYKAPTMTYNDPSDFRSIYMAAGAQFGVPWQLLEAVHYVETGKSGSTQRSSYAGAQGPMQFMPGTWRAYAVDGNGDGTADINNVCDAIFGAAKLLAAGGAAEGNIDGALYNYNHAGWYVTKVKTLAYEIGLPR